MRSVRNDVFRIVNLRGPTDGLTLDPAKDGIDSAILTALTGTVVDVTAPTPATLRLVAAVNIDKAGAAALADLYVKLSAAKVDSIRALRAERVQAFGRTEQLGRLAATQDFRDAYRSTYDEWLTRLLRHNPARPPSDVEPALRAAHVAVVAGRDAGDDFPVTRLLHAELTVPATWTRGQQSRSAARARRAGVARPATPGLDAQIATARSEYTAALARIGELEQVQSVAHRLYRTKLAARSAALPPVLTLTVDPARRAQDRQTRYARNSALRTFRRRTAAPIVPDQRFGTELQAALTQPQAAALQDAFGPGVRKFPLPGFGDLAGRLDDQMTKDVDSANAACAQVRALARERATRLPTARTASAAVPQPAVSALGWGDLIVARERLVGYTAREVSHIENVMAGERKQRDHTSKRTVTDVLETETVEQTETERELTSTDRNELQTESSRTIEEEFSVEAGVNTSGRYGLTSVETSLDLGLRRSTSEAQRATTSVAKEIVSRSVDRTLTSTRTLRRLTTIDELTEFNQHLLDNTRGAAPVSRSGIYLWVQKTHEMELRHYGTRLMLEFHIPEPAISVLGYDRHEPAIPAPPPFRISPDAVNVGNYLCLMREFEATGVQAPPSQFIEVGYPWASAPDEEADDDEAEEALAATIPIPDGYQPVSAHGLVTALPIALEDFVVSAALGGKRLCESDGGEALVEDDVVWSEGDAGWPWAGGVPFSLLSHGHFDKTLVVHITIHCERTAKAQRSWQLKTWEQLRQGHERQMADYEQRVAQSDFEAGLFPEQDQRPAAVNRRTEREELEKWAVTILRGEAVDFDAIEDAAGAQELDLDAAAGQASLVQFYEEAFEWEHMSYFFYPYFWGRRDAWRFRQSVRDPDSRYEAFLRAGSAKAIVPVTPGYERRVLHYLDSPELPETERVAAPPDVPSAASEHAALWLELLLAENTELAVGSGRLRVTPNSAAATLVDSTWVLQADRDIGRELFIEGEQYEVARVIAPDELELSDPYPGAATADVQYAAGSVPFGAPWLVSLPTTLVVLAEEAQKLPTG